MKKIGLCLAVTALILSIIALSLDKWEIVINTRTWENSQKGLWKVCEKDTCVELPHTMVLNFVRGLMCLGMLLLVVNVVFQGIGAFVTDHDVLSVLSCGTAFLAGTFLMSAFSVYCDNILGADGWKAGSGFYLTVVTWLLAWTASATAGYQKSKA
ncbi:uncharacterized protein LOC128207201 [Mya arenaria]|uniref:uncharacterized protein LOC128207201 n=1 Tax=Mya arenaria TaxID=6604 RepID=UPI0022E2F91E|nr:uncharacterized protein LOC128207201 [Mya arenaria]